jgi:hypothetical protein
MLLQLYDIGGEGEIMCLVKKLYWLKWIDGSKQLEERLAIRLMIFMQFNGYIMYLVIDYPLCLWKYQGENPAISR